MNTQVHIGVDAVSELLHNLGLVYNNSGRYEQAIDAYLDAMRSMKAGIRLLVLGKILPRWLAKRIAGRRVPDHFNRTTREVLENRSLAVSVDGDWRRASELGITGVPTFVINGRGVVGAQPYDTLEQLVTQGGAERRS